MKKYEICTTDKINAKLLGVAEHRLPFTRLVGECSRPLRSFAAFKTRVETRQALAANRNEEKKFGKNPRLIVKKF